jgi:cytochrome c oxidase assembly factor CtaG
MFAQGMQSYFVTNVTGETIFGLIRFSLHDYSANVVGSVVAVLTVLTGPDF